MTDAVVRLARQIGKDPHLLEKELEWALGEERINRVTPSIDQFKAWQTSPTGLWEFWGEANKTLNAPLDLETAKDIWECIKLTLSSRKRRAFNFADYISVAMGAEQKCEFCGKRPPEVQLDIDHILPASTGGTNALHNLRFLCVHCNRGRGNRFRWAEVWRKI